MTITEIAGLLGGAGGLGTAALVGIGKAWTAYQSRKERERLAEIEAHADEAERDNRTEERLWQRLDRVEEAQQECDDERRRDRAQYESDREDCKQEIAALREEVREAREDITQRVELAAERVATRRESPLPPPPKRRDGK